MNGERDRRRRGAYNWPRLFQVDPSWYERYWWSDPAPRRLNAFAFFRRIGVASMNASWRIGTMYYDIVVQCVHNLKTLELWLDKAEELATAKGFDIDVLMQGRIAPDMYGFIYQVQSACDYIKGAAAWLSGQTPPRHEDNEKTIGDVRARIRKTVAFVEVISKAQYEGASGRRVTMSWAPGKVIGGKDYLLQVIMPNVYFHLGMAYAILRHNGVDIGKKDFLGQVNFVAA